MNHFFNIFEPTGTTPGPLRVALAGDRMQSSRALFAPGVFSRVKHLRYEKPYFRAKTVDDLLRHALERFIFFAPYPISTQKIRARQQYE